jgi:hypothetical protein
MPDPGGPIGGSGSAVRIAVASGKGGTGKTTVAVNLALGADRAGLVDCDVEEPNCHLFLGLPMEHAGDVTVAVPVMDPDLCLLCGGTPWMRSPRSWPSCASSSVASTTRSRPRGPRGPRGD